VLRPFFPLLLLLPFTASLLLAGCTAKLEETCIGGKCNPDGVPAELTPPPSETGGGIIVCTTFGPATGDIPCDVFEVMHRTCHACHNKDLLNGAPFPLLSYEDTQAPYGPDRKIFQRMNEVIRPDGAPRMPLGGMLDAKDQQILGDWLNLCTPIADSGMGCECPGTGCTCPSAVKECSN
jgi:hypothetical protein